MHAGIHPPRADTPLGRHAPWADTPWADTPPADGHCSGRYGSYWNAFLFHYKFCSIKNTAILILVLIQAGQNGRLAVDSMLHNVSVGKLISVTQIEILYLKIWT